jgi:hypothetical protein
MRVFVLVVAFAWLALTAFAQRATDAMTQQHMRDLRDLKMHPFSYKANYVLGASLVAQGKYTDEAKLNLNYASERHPEAKPLLAKWPAQTAAK